MPRKKTSSSNRAPSQRMLRVGEQIRHVVAELLARGEIHDEVIASHVITITQVRMSTDLRLATAFVMPLGGRDTAEVIEALEKNRRYIRGQIAQTLDLQFSPDIRFKDDNTFEEAMRIDMLLASPKVRQDTEKKGQ
jgi:ribosome-binding factor A